MTSPTLAKNGTILFDFPVSKDHVKNVAGLEKVEEAVLIALKSDFGPLKRVLHLEMMTTDDTRNYLRVFAEPFYGITMTLRTFQDHLMVTATLEYDRTRWPLPATHPFTYDDVKNIEKSIIEQLNMKKDTKAIPEVKRGLKHDIYFNTSDDRLLEYDVKEMLFDKKSKYQHVQIARSVNYGNMLILDDLLNLAESDLIYTETLMRRGDFDYKDKKILILGGGDGALLNELLKEDPAHVTMIDIDDTVMQACKLHMRSVCDDVLDDYEQEKQKIIVGDCVEFINECVKRGRNFDVIFGDLTDIPISEKPQGEVWDFIKNVMELSFKILNRKGVFMTHANGYSSPSSLRMFEKTVRTLFGETVRLERAENFIPSFMERWVFYQLHKLEKTKISFSLLNSTNKNK